MGRKRKSAPQRIDEAKRGCLSWNMSDLSADVQVVADNDPSLIQEAQDAAAAQASSAHPKPQTIRPNSLICQDGKVQDLIDECDFFLHVRKEANFRENEWSCKLGIITIKCSDISKLKWMKNYFMPNCTDFYLYISPDPERHLIYVESEENVETSKSKSKGNHVEPLAFFYVSCDVPYDILDGLQQKSAFRLDIHSIDSQQRIIR